MKISALSKVYVPAEVSARDAGAVVDLSADTVQMAFPLAEVPPVSGDWKAATWEVDTTATPRRYLARCLVGPGGTVVLGANLYDIWVKVTHTPEVPALKAPEQLEVF